MVVRYVHPHLSGIDGYQLTDGALVTTPIPFVPIFGYSPRSLQNRFIDDYRRRCSRLKQRRLWTRLQWRRFTEKFWSYYAHMIRPHDLLGHADIHLFKDGIRPLWEDDANKNGGKWIVRLKKGLANRCWENLILALLGEQFMVGEEICGAVVSIRSQVNKYF